MSAWEIGLDVGSTTLKAVVVETTTGDLVWREYERHETRQAERALDMLGRIEAAFPGTGGPERFRVAVTGSGGAALTPHLGARFVQEVTAVALAVERRHPGVSSVVELGGQDAKIIIFRRDPGTGRTAKVTSMNDKCAGGTGAVLDKIASKLSIAPEDLAGLAYRGVKLHPVAGKCGVFAETDVNSLQKLGVPAAELMASVYEAIVGQNLSVLTRGNTLRPEVLLLGGPHAFLPGLVEAWQENLVRLWQERGVEVDAAVEDLVRVPDHAVYFAALGAVEQNRAEPTGAVPYRGLQELRRRVEESHARAGAVQEGRALATGPGELEDFLDRYRTQEFQPVAFRPGQTVEAFIGLDGGSTSTKAVLLGHDRTVLAKTYQLSRGNPIEDAKEVLSQLEEHVTGQGASLRVLGAGTTGYAKDVLREALGADVSLVETVAHTRSALNSYGDVDVICDVGGQDIKIILLKNGQVTDFRLNTQCSAGNGYFLQSTAELFGWQVQEFAETAFAARRMPTFGYGCAVFLQADIVDFQRQGWRPEEIMAGLAAVLPKNIWLYVAQMPNLPALGSTFVLQGGTQRNLAAVKAQVDFITSRFRGQERPPTVRVHEHCGEAGAIGSALEAARVMAQGGSTSFIGMSAVRELSYRTHRSEETRCTFCKNNCLRTFVDVTVHSVPLPAGPTEPAAAAGLPIPAGARRIVVGHSCERGEAQDVSTMRVIKKSRDAASAAHPNFAALTARAVWRARRPEPVLDPPRRGRLTARTRRRNMLLAGRSHLRIGIPRALNLYSTNPFFSAYFEALGIPARNLVYSDVTTDRLYREGVRRSSVDPCFPSKLGIPHVHNLLFTHHRRRPLDLIFFPMIDALPPALPGTAASRSCATVTATPEAVKAAFRKEGDVFAELGVRYLDPIIDLADRRMCERQMFLALVDVLGLTPGENERAIQAGYRELEAFWAQLRGQAREVIDRLEVEDRIGIVLLGRPYHDDPGINHGILDDLQQAGYPVLTCHTLPTDTDLLERLFGDEVAAGAVDHPFDISDVWKQSYSENTSRKLWAAKFTARHPNLVAVELSSFKCGHDAPVYSTVQRIIQDAATPYFCFKDIDENKSPGSVRLRIETITYSIERYRHDVLLPHRRRLRLLDQHMADAERRLRAEVGLTAG
jgi:activator of 2-hydroxyglutaryl-CoA dehydratase/predicted nucleotide-binding protein (sugar kinase/HSP70/actin superfamily)